MQTPEEFAAMLDRCAHAAEGMGERLTDTYRVADLIRERDAEVRADERAKVLADVDNIARASSLSATDVRLILDAIRAVSGLEWEAAPCGQTKWTPGADPLLKAIECEVSPTKHGDWHNAGGHRWRVTDDLPVLPSRTRLVSPWEPTP